MPDLPKTVDAATSTHNSVGTDTQADWQADASNNSSNADPDGKGPAVGNMENKNVSNDDSTMNGEVDCSGHTDQEDIKTGNSGLTEQAKDSENDNQVPYGTDKVEYGMVLVDKPEGNDHALFGDDEEKENRMAPEKNMTPAPASSPKEGKELTQVEKLEREITKLKDTIITLEDENQDLRIHYGEMECRLYQCCSLEYAQRMELFDVSNKYTALQEEHKTLQQKVRNLEEEVSTTGARVK